MVISTDDRSMANLYHRAWESLLDNRSSPSHRSFLAESDIAKNTASVEAQSQVSRLGFRRGGPVVGLDGCLSKHRLQASSRRHGALQSP
jgi:hypothetical protein